MVNEDLTAMRALYWIVALTMAAQPAWGWEVRTSCTSSRAYGSSSCRTVGTAEAPSRDRAQETADLEEREERISAWEAFCRPMRTEDKFGVVRLVYAHANCDFGRTR
jgi:hypothetical protein